MVFLMQLDRRWWHLRQLLNNPCNLNVAVPSSHQLPPNLRTKFEPNTYMPSRTANVPEVTDN
jgi:hypothetical protein